MESLSLEIKSYLNRTPKSEKMHRRASKYLPGGSSRDASFFAPYPIFIERGSGTHIFDVDGNQYLDYMINATSLILGHSHPVPDASELESERTVIDDVAGLGPVRAAMLFHTLPVDGVERIEGNQVGEIRSAILQCDHQGIGGGDPDPNLGVKIR